MHLFSTCAKTGHFYASPVWNSNWNPVFLVVPTLFIGTSKVKALYPKKGHGRLWDSHSISLEAYGGAWTCKVEFSTFEITVSLGDWISKVSFRHCQWNSQKIYYELTLQILILLPHICILQHTTSMGASINYVDKQGGKGVSQKSTKLKKFM